MLLILSYLISKYFEYAYFKNEFQPQYGLYNLCSQKSSEAVSFSSYQKDDFLHQLFLNLKVKIETAKQFKEDLQKRHKLPSKEMFDFIRKTAKLGELTKKEEDFLKQPTVAAQSKQIFG